MVAESLLMHTEEIMGLLSSRPYPTGVLDLDAPPEIPETDLPTLEQWNREVAIDQGADAVGIELANTEAALLEAYPGSKDFHGLMGVHRLRQQHSTYWTIYLTVRGISLVANGDKLADAVDDLRNKIAGLRSAWTAA